MKWKDNTNIAVLLTFDFDAESLWISRDKTNVNRPGTLSQGTFGAKIGVPSILELLREEEVKSTFFIPGWVAEQYEGLVHEILKEGHEIGHHGYLHEWIDPNEPELEREVFYKGMESLEKITGKKPVGYRSPAWETSNNLIDILLENDFLYSSNFMDDYYPYFVKKDGEKTGLVELPVNWMLDDAPFFLFSVKPPSRPIFPAATAMQVWKEEFNSLYKRGALFNLAMHPQLIGRASRIDMLREFIRYMKSFSHVWFATAEEIALYYKNNQEKFTGSYSLYGGKQS